MKPGPDLDSEVVRKVFGGIVVLNSETGRQRVLAPDMGLMDIPKFSQDLVAAAALVDFWRDRTYRCRFVPNELGQIMACFCPDDDRDYEFTTGDTHALAVCLASLEAARRAKLYEDFTNDCS